jgi:broad specificity phosphatase PhoE
LSYYPWRALAAERPVAVISSPMRRAVETVEPIARACGVEWYGMD